jgi:hypothetical protein
MAPQAPPVRLHCPSLGPNGSRRRTPRGARKHGRGAPAPKAMVLPTTVFILAKGCRPSSQVRLARPIGEELRGRRVAREERYEFSRTCQMATRRTDEWTRTPWPITTGPTKSTLASCAMARRGPPGQVASVASPVPAVEPKRRPTAGSGSIQNLIAASVAAGNEPTRIVRPGDLAAVRIRFGEGAPIDGSPGPSGVALSVRPFRLARRLAGQTKGHAELGRDAIASLVPVQTRSAPRANDRQQVFVIWRDSLELSVAVSREQPETPVVDADDKFALALTLDLHRFGNGRYPSTLGGGASATTQSGAWGSTAWLAIDFRLGASSAIVPMAGVALGTLGPTPYEPDRSAGMAGIKWFHSPGRGCFWWEAEALAQTSIRGQASRSAAGRFSALVGVVLPASFSVSAGARAALSPALDIPGVGLGGGWEFTPIVNFGWDDSSLRSGGT